MTPASRGFWFGLCLVLVSGVATANGEGRVSIRWDAPDECPDDVQLVHETEALLGQSLLSAVDQSLTVRASVQGDEASGYRAKLSFVGPRGEEERSLEHPSCEKLTQAVALMVALAIDPERVRGTQLARDSAKDGAPAPVPVESRKAPAEAVAAVSHSRVIERAPPPASESGAAMRGLRVALRGQAGAGPLPSFGAGLEGAVGWHRQGFRAEIVGRYWVPRTVRVSDSQAASLQLGLDTVGARACWLALSGAWSLAGCAGGDLGDQSATGVGVLNPRQQHALYADLAGGVQLAYARSRLMPEGGFELSGALARPRFGVSEGGRETETFRPAAWAFSAFLGLAFEL